MRTLAVPVVVALVMASCSGGSSTPAGDQTSLTFPEPVATDTTGSPSTTSGEPAPTSTSTTTTGATSPPTTAVGVEATGDACNPYWDLAVAGNDREVADALRRLSIVIARPSPDELLEALEVLRNRSSALSPEMAAATLDSFLLESCGDPPPSYPGRFDVLNAQGVMLAGPDGVRLLDETELVPADSVGTYFASFGDSRGATTSLLEIQGLEIVEYQEGSEAVPRDLLLGEDIWLHDVAEIDARTEAVVTTWELDGFGEPVQHLDLVPVDGSESRRIAQVGGIEFGVTTVSYAQGLFLVTDVSDGGGSVRVFDLSGVEFQADWLPDPVFGLGASFVEPYQFARFAPNGETFAYLRVTPGVGAGGADILRTELVVRRIADAAELLNVEIGGLDDTFTSLAYDGHWVLVVGRDGLVVVDTWSERTEVAGISLPNVESVSLLDGGLNYGP